MKFNFKILLILILSANSYGQASIFNTSQEMGTSFSTNNNNTSINLFNINFDGKEIPISLVYSHDGVKVNETNTSLGLKWRISNLGLINRVVNYLPDNTPNGWFNSQNPSFDTNVINIACYDDCPQDLGGLTENDLSPDFFSANILWTDHFDFLYKKNIVNGIIGLPTPQILSNSNGYKINTFFNAFNTSCNPNNNSVVFNIYNNEGVKYDFINGPVLDDFYRNPGGYCRNNFYLKSVHNSNNTDFITIDYLYMNNLKSKYNTTGFMKHSLISEPNNVDMENNIVSANSFRSFHYTIDESTFEIKKITTNTQVIDFTYNNDYLDEINISDLNGNYIKGFKFEYINFGNTNESNRKTLGQIKKYNNSKTELEVLYTFEYNEGQNFFNDLGHNEDYLGYNNGQYKTNLLPFRLRNYSTGTIIAAGDFEPNLDAAKEHALYRIINKYGGVTEFDYQLNSEFEVGYGGGLLIHSIKTIPNIGNPTLKLYNYEHLTGLVMQTPFLASQFFSTGFNYGIKLYRNIPILTAAEIDLGNTYIYKNGNYFGMINEYLYDYNTMTLNSKKLNLFHFNFEGISVRPTLHLSIDYNANGDVVKETEFNYSDTIMETLQSAEQHTEIRFVGVNYGVTEKKNTPIIINRSKLNYIKSTIYSTNGNLITTKNFDYIDSNTSILRKETLVTSLGTINENRFYYAQDLSQEPQAANLISKNIIGVPLKTETYQGTEKLSEQKTIYAQDATTGNLLQPKYVYAKKGNDVDATLEKKLTYDLYDSNGNLCQYTQENGISTAIIYGYNKTKPIAKLEYVSYSSIPTTTITDLQTKSNADIDASSELILRTALDNLRTTFPNAMITTYTYDPLIGVTSVTDPKGDRQTYTYDSFGRLLNVKDKDGNTLTENDYHYKP